MVRVSEFLNNAAVAAFVGAFSAFILFVANDWRRRRRKKRLLIYLVDENGDLARRTLESVRTYKAMLENNIGIDTNLMKFPTSALSNYQHDVMDMLDANENQALSGLIFWMDSINYHMEETRQAAKLSLHLSETNAAIEQRSHAANQLYQQLQVAERHLGSFIDLCDYYVAGDPHKILEFQHPIGMAGIEELKIERRRDSM